MNPLIINLWINLNKFNVKYITIGGLAVNAYGYIRNTGDIDLLIEDTKENRINLRKTFVEIGLGDIEQIETMQFIPGWTDFAMEYGLRLDIMTSIKGLEDKPFEQLLEDATIMKISQVEVYFIDYENLIISKKAANRPKDLLDIEELEKVNNFKP